jgi:hypothetical protein
MRLDPLRVVCVRPAPKSRFAVIEPFVPEDQKQIKRFPAEAGPTVGAIIVGPALAGKLLMLIVPTLRVVMPPLTLRAISRTIP